MLIDYFLRGGWVMWPILGASIVALAVVVNRLLHLLRTRGDAAGLTREVLSLVDERRIAEARSLCSPSRIPSAAVLEAGLSGWGLAQEEQERRMEQAAADQLAASEHLLPLLASMVAVLPMLGFLGTILGLIGAFSVWAAAGANVSIEQLASGISEAMITTAAGLLTSIPYVLAYNALSASSAGVARSLNSAASSLAGRHRTREAEDAEDAEASPVAVLSVGSATKVFDRRELELLPEPVQRYFRAVLADGQPIVAAVRLEQTGTFNLNEATGNWKPFTSTQQVVTCRPGFDWDARITLLPGLSARVHDAYVAGEGFLHAAVYGLVSMVNLRGGGEVARGELMRFFAESPWYPTALLPSQGIGWSAVDQHSAHATLRDGELTITLLFRFNAEGLIDAVHADARGRTSGGKAVSMPWEGRFWNYAEREGMRVPLEAEVAWIHPDGAKPYWRGQIIQSAYEFAH